MTEPHSPIAIERLRVLVDDRPRRHAGHHPIKDRCDELLKTLDLPR